jgi:hypothetical protein
MLIVFVVNVVDACVFVAPAFGSSCGMRVIEYGVGRRCDSFKNAPRFRP